MYSSTNSIKNQSLFLIHLLKGLTTFSYAVLYSSLALFLTQSFGISILESNSMVGLFIAANFGFHLVSGFIGGRYISQRSLFLASTALQIPGLCLLGLGNSYLLYPGLMLFLVGCGFNSTSLNCLISEMIPKSDKREHAFFINYAAMNAGFFLGFLAAGISEMHNSYSFLFIFQPLQICLL